MPARASVTIVGRALVFRRSVTALFAQSPSNAFRWTSIEPPAPRGPHGAVVGVRGRSKPAGGIRAGGRAGGAGPAGPVSRTWYEAGRRVPFSRHSPIQAASPEIQPPIELVGWGK